MIQPAPIKAIVTDIEGTTSSIAFVKDVLFPYARAYMDAFVRAHETELSDILADVRRQAQAPALNLDGVIAQLLEWMATDQKITPLKTLQGLIWRMGYDSGALQSDIYPDAARGLQRWHKMGMKLYVYSSGSVAAQKLLFAHTPAGDLTPIFSGYFDTTTGGKQDSASYAKIARQIGLEPAAILFLSDVAAELIAARQVGMHVIMLVRDGGALDPEFAATRSFDTILAQEQTA